MFGWLYYTVVSHCCYFWPFLSFWVSPGEAIARLKRNISQHYWIQLVARICLPKLLYIELERMPGRNTVVRTWLSTYDIMQHPQMFHEQFEYFELHTPCCKTSQQGSQTRTTWPNNIALKCCDRLAGAVYVRKFSLYYIGCGVSRNLLLQQ